MAQSAMDAACVLWSVRGTVLQWFPVSENPGTISRAIVSTLLFAQKPARANPSLELAVGFATLNPTPLNSLSGLRLTAMYLKFLIVDGSCDIEHWVLNCQFVFLTRLAILSNQV
jgi:hypothetical protein